MHAMAVVAAFGLALAVEGSVPTPKNIQAYSGPFRIDSALENKAQLTHRDVLLKFKVTNGSRSALHGCLDGGGGLIYSNSRDPDGVLIIGPSIHPGCERDFDLQPGESFDWETTWLATGLPLGEVRVVPWLNVWTGAADKFPWQFARVPAAAISLLVTKTGISAGGQRPNYGVNATVRPVTPLACASVAPVRPARYALRSADKN